MDYGFGRGNWTLAFNQLKAKGVVSVDISKFNVTQLQNIVRDLNINKKITVINSDYSQEDTKIPYHDLHWNYGVFHHIKEIEMFLNNLSSQKNMPTRGLFYAYEKNTIRSEVINEFRNFVQSPINPAVFYKNRDQFNTRAYLRCIDDYSAPVVNFFTEKQLIEVLNKSFSKEKYSFIRVPSLVEFNSNYLHDPEFNAIHILFDKEMITKAQEVKYSKFRLENHLVPKELLLKLSRLLSTHKNESFEKRFAILVDFHNDYYKSFQYGIKGVIDFLENFEVVKR